MFARQVLANCVFCGLRPAAFGATRMMLAGHIKPWKHSTPAERLDPHNGLAVCPAHDVAFDTGMLIVNGGLRIHSPNPWPTPSRPTHSSASTTASHLCAR